MVVELVNTGSELMLGSVLNSHQQWLCRHLSDLGLIVARQIAVPDTTPAIESAVRESLSRADLVITTGGLGPTSDDLTRNSIARLLGRNLREDPESLARIRMFYGQRNRPVPAAALIQAMVPEGAEVLQNPQGTAPGLALHVKPNPFRPGGSESWLIMLPGPGRELRPMFDQAVVPFLQRALPANAPFVCLTLRTIGVAESVVQEMIEPPLRKSMPGELELGYCARPGQVDVRLLARGPSARDCVDWAETIVRAHLGLDIFGTGEQSLEEVAIRVMIEHRKTLAVAESCTGGLICHRLTNVPGASTVLRAGWISYGNEAKIASLGVNPRTLDLFGAVSPEVAKEMAAGARLAAKSDFAIAVTGIAGPTGGTSAKPVGTVFIALATPLDIQVRHEVNAWDRLTFKEITAQQALNQLRLAVVRLG